MGCCSRRCSRRSSIFIVAVVALFCGPLAVQYSYASRLQVTSGPSSSKYKVNVYSEETHGKYACSLYIEHLTQEQGHVPQPLIAFETFIGSLQEPDEHSEKNALTSLDLFDPMADEHIEHQTWLNLVYSCRLGPPRSKNVAHAHLLDPSDTVLQRVVKLGMSQVLLALQRKGLYEEGHYFHARDKDGNSLVHLATLSGNAQTLRQLANILAENTFHLLEGPYSKNKAGLRPWDMANSRALYHMKQELNSLYEVYRHDAKKHKPPPVPSDYKLPTIRIVQKQRPSTSGGSGMGSVTSGGIGSMGGGGGGSMQFPAGWHTGNQHRPVRPHSQLPTGDAVIKSHPAIMSAPPGFGVGGNKDDAENAGASAVASAGVMRDPDVLMDDLTRTSSGSSRALYASLAVLGGLVLLGIGAGVLYTLTAKPR